VDKETWWRCSFNPCFFHRNGLGLHWVSLVRERTRIWMQLLIDSAIDWATTTMATHRLLRADNHDATAYSCFTTPRPRHRSRPPGPSISHLPPCVARCGRRGGRNIFARAQPNDGDEVDWLASYWWSQQTTRLPL